MNKPKPMSYLQYSTMHKNNYESNIEKLASFEYKKTLYIFSPFNKVWSCQFINVVSNEIVMVFLFSKV